MGLGRQWPSMTILLYSHFPFSDFKACKCKIYGVSSLPLLLLPPSCASGSEEEETSWAAADSDWRDVVHHWVSAGGTRECQHKHRGPEKHEHGC